MKKTFITLAAMAAFIACEDMPDQAPVMENAPLKINVGVQTKGLITETTLPDASKIGTFFVDESGTTYNGISVNNLRFTASGTGASQVWTPDLYVGVGTADGTLYSYYPYSANTTDKTAVPVKANASHQVDYLYATPATGINNQNATVTLTMNHALAALRFNIEKGMYAGDAQLTSIGLKGGNIATAATLDVTTGELANYTGTGAYINNIVTPTTLSATASVFEFIVVPVKDASEAVTVELTVDKKLFSVEIPATTLAQGTIHDYTLVMDSGAVLTKVSVTPWNTTQNTSYVTDSAQPATVQIKHKDGSLWSAEEWTDGKSAGLLTNADATGVAIPDPNDPYTYCFVVCKTIPTKNFAWSSNTTVSVPNVSTSTTAFNGKANTDAILAAVAAGTIEDAPAAQECAKTTFADGKKGYLPSAAEVCHIMKYIDSINSCLAVCGNSSITTTLTISTSTQYSTAGIWFYTNEGLKNMSGSYYQSDKARTRSIIPICEF